MKKIINVITGLSAGLIIVLIINPMLADAFNGFISVLLPLLLSIVFIEASVIISLKKEPQYFSIALLVFQVVNMSYVLIYIIAAVISVAVGESSINTMAVLLKQSGYTNTRQLIILLISTVVLLTYINFALKRMKKNLPIIIENKNRETGNAKR